MILAVKYILAPALGGLIGFITNDIAIRMLFRPHTAKYIGRVHIPFTPGIIPKEKGRIAESIGDVISKNLLDQETLGKYLLSDEMIGKLRSSVESIVEKQKINEETVEQFLSHYLTAEEMQSIKESVNDGLTDQIKEKLNDEALGKKVAELAMDSVAKKLSGEGVQVLLGSVGGMMGGLGGAAASLLGGGVIGKFLEMLREPAQNYLADKINIMLQNNGQEIVSGMVGGEVDSFLGKRICDLLKGREELLDKVPDKVESLYRTIINNHLPKILGSIDISKIVCDRINEMDVAETEKLIFQVMAKELKAIVWLGAGLGLIMGCINLLLP